MVTETPGDSSPTGPQDPQAGYAERSLNERLAYLEGYSRGFQDAMQKANEVIDRSLERARARIFSPLTGNKHVTEESEKPF